MRQQGKRGQRIAVVPTILVVAARFSHTPNHRSDARIDAGLGLAVEAGCGNAWCFLSLGWPLVWQIRGGVRQNESALKIRSSATVQASGKGHVHNAGIRGIGPLAGRLGADLLARVWPAWRDPGAAEPCEAGP